MIEYDKIFFGNFMRLCGNVPIGRLTDYCYQEQLEPDSSALNDGIIPEFEPWLPTLFDRGTPLPSFLEILDSWVQGDEDFYKLIEHEESLMEYVKRFCKPVPYEPGIKPTEYLSYLLNCAFQDWVYRFQNFLKEKVRLFYAEVKPFV
jgi:hypothetical protein